MQIMWKAECQSWNRSQNTSETEPHMREVTYPRSHSWLVAEASLGKEWKRLVN